jgi:hypothetical protein
MFNDTITTETVILHGGTDSENSVVDLSLTESGDITGNVTGDIEPSETVEESFCQAAGSQPLEFDEFHGETRDGVPVTLEKVITSTEFDGRDGTARVIGITPSIVVFDSAPDDAFVGEDVTIKFDVLNFRAPNTWVPQPDDTPLLERDEFSLQSHRMDRFEERLQQIKEYRRSLRTATITLTQSVNGPTDIQFDHASCTLQPAMWLIAFVQGVFPSPVRARITAVDGDAVPWTYERWMTTWREDIGHAFSGGRIDGMNDVRVFLDHGYDQFVERAEQYRYQRCISWYLDAMLRDRTVNARIASVAAGMEVLAERYAAHEETVGSATADKIRNLVTSLNVDVDDLAAFSETFEDTPDGTKEYFYSNSRNFVLHNERDDMPFDNVFTDYEAAITLLRRVLVNEFVLDEERDRYMSLLDLSPADKRFE